MHGRGVSPITSAVRVGCADPPHWHRRGGLPHRRTRGPDTAGVVPAAGAPAEAQDLISSETVVSFDTAGRRTTTYRATTQILAQSAFDSNEGVGIRWSPWYQVCPEIKAWVTSTEVSGSRSTRRRV